MANLGQVSDFIRSIHASLAAGSPSSLNGLRVLSKRNEGSLFLDRSESAQFDEAVAALRKTFGKKPDISQKTVEQYLRDALFGALDLQKRSQAPFEDRLALAIDELKASLAKLPVDYKCYLPLAGCDASGLPWTFGAVRLVVFNETQVKHIVAAAGRTRNDASVLGVLEGVQRAASWNQPVAIVTVPARDDDAARDLATKRVQQTVDCMNFFVDLIPYNHGWVYLPGEAASVLGVSPVTGTDGSVSALFQWQGPLRPFSVQSLKTTASLRPALSRVHRMLREQPGSKLDQSVLASVQWAGRASAEQKKEEAFILFAIALETLVLPDSSTQELTYRLRVRAAHLLGHDANARKEISQLIGHLYNVRSRIVHSGFYEVTDEDLGRLKAIVIRCVLRTLLHRRIRQLKTPEELASWFDYRVLH